MRSIGPTFLSTQIFPQSSIRKIQAELANAQQELSTQRQSDVALTLGYQTGRNIRWHAELQNVEDNILANGLQSTRSDLTQTSLRAASTLAEDFLKNLIGSRGADGGQKIIQSQAKNALSALQDALNVDIDGVFLFGGRNQTSTPLVAFAGSATQAQIGTLFQSEFGMANGDAATLNLTSNQMETFLNGSFSTLFASPNWESAISNATGENVLAQVSRSENIDVLANANEKPVKEIYAALVAVSEMSTGSLNSAAFRKLVDAAVSKVSSAVQGLADMQARVGINQKSLEDATKQLRIGKTWLNEAISKTESVDTYEVATRINAFTTQLEASYSVTSRLSRISLLNYL